MKLGHTSKCRRRKVDMRQGTNRRPIYIRRYHLQFNGYGDPAPWICSTL